MQIGTRTISPGNPVYVIAEIGVNHDGDPQRALQLTDAAASAGADAVKLQFFETDRLMSRAAKLAAYQSAAGETNPIDMLRRLELTIEQMAPVVHRAHELRIHAIVTVFSAELVAQASALPWDAYKTASPDIIHQPLLHELVGTFKPMIVSTGASTLEEVERANEWLSPAADRLAFLQCVSAYPAPESAIEGIPAITHATGKPTGYSDHTPSIQTGALAVRAGAVILEKHLTDDRNAVGPDHAASLEPDQLAEYIRLAKETPVPEPLGMGTKQLLDAERDVREVSRQSIVAARAIRAGEPITKDMLTCKRPGSGLEPWRLNAVIGSATARDIDPDTPLTETDLR